MIRDGEVIGSIGVCREEPGLLPTSECGLLQIFADQAVIAIENVRLFNETKEALERQTATAEILRVISSSPTDVQPVFDAIVERARVLCGARSAASSRYDGELLHMVGLPRRPRRGDGAMRGAFRCRLARLSSAGPVLSRAPVQIADVQLDPDYAPSAAPTARGAASARGGVPMLRDGRGIGVDRRRRARSRAVRRQGRSRCCRPSPTRR